MERVSKLDNQLGILAHLFNEQTLAPTPQQDLFEFRDLRLMERITAQVWVWLYVGEYAQTGNGSMKILASPFSVSNFSLNVSHL